MTPSVTAWAATATLAAATISDDLAQVGVVVTCTAGTTSVLLCAADRLGDRLAAFSGTRTQRRGDGARHDGGRQRECPRVVAGDRGRERDSQPESQLRGGPAVTECTHPDRPVTRYQIAIRDEAGS